MLYDELCREKQGTGKSRFKKLYFSFLKSIYVLSKKDLYTMSYSGLLFTTESENRSSEKKSLL